MTPVTPDPERHFLKGTFHLTRDPLDLHAVSLDLLAPLERQLLVWNSTAFVCGDHEIHVCIESATPLPENALETVTVPCAAQYPGIQMRFSPSRKADRLTVTRPDGNTRTWRVVHDFIQMDDPEENQPFSSLANTIAGYRPGCEVTYEENQPRDAGEPLWRTATALKDLSAWLRADLAEQEQVGEQDGEQGSEQVDRTYDVPVEGLIPVQTTVTVTARNAEEAAGLALQELTHPGATPRWKTGEGHRISGPVTALHVAESGAQVAKVPPRLPHIAATITSDNGVFDFTVNAAPVFERLEAQDVRNMIGDEFNSGDGTDIIALMLEGEDERVDAMFAMNRAIQDMGVREDYGFFCTADPRDVLRWLERRAESTSPEWAQVTAEVRQFIAEHLDDDAPAPDSRKALAAPIPEPDSREVSVAPVPRRYRIGVPVMYRNTEYVTVSASSEEEALALAQEQVDAEASIEQALAQDTGVARILKEEIWTEDAEEEGAAL